MTTNEQTTSGIIEQHRTSAGLLLALLGQTAMRRLRDAHTTHHLSPRQFHLLGLLHDHGPTGQQELGQSMGVDPSVLVTLLNPLEADGYVSRQRDPADRRRHVVALSPAGGQHLADAAHAQHAAEDQLFSALDTDQREQLRQLLLALQANLHPDQAPRCSPQPPTTASQSDRWPQTNQPSTPQHHPPRCEITSKSASAQQHPPGKGAPAPSSRR